MRKYLAIVMALFLVSMAVPLTTAIGENGSSPIPSMGSLGRPITALQYFYYLRYKEGIEKFDELYNKSVELGVSEETLEMALEYKEMAEKEYELAWKFGHPLKGHIQTFVHMRRAYLYLMEAIEILEKAIEELESS
ncbi:hypothetical protein [Thermococcus alcaliphilus]|uniref:hypothetical protein n=1 Tax=Thermococcus alcaliphilus TaxID=139207 RepID=UPI002091E3BE|nr:hypothetical protein [Thermococcus alcaliphilus]MCO6041064.1 hypothetical protein [Thermococcus alcaliphilus]